jgi:DNA-binding NtrC family response regulator
MSLAMMRILVVGKSIPSTRAMLDRLELSGWGSQSVETLREARGALGTFQFDVVLCAESLSGGRGYDLVELVAGQTATLYVAVALSESCLWLAAVERGQRTLGKHGLDPRKLELEVMALLSSLHASTLCAVPLRPPHLLAGARQKMEKGGSS